MKLTGVAIEGFKSIRKADLCFADINILIGPNGSGKSNLLDFFTMLGSVMNRSLQEYVQKSGGSNDLLYHGSKETREIKGALTFSDTKSKNEYQFALMDTTDNSLVISYDECRYTDTNRFNSTPEWQRLSEHNRETQIKSKQNKTAKFVLGLLQCGTYQFHDTSDTSPIKRGWDVDTPKNYMRGHGGNLPVILLQLKNNEPEIYQRIVEIIQRVFPFFKDFILEEFQGKANLYWHGIHGDKAYGPHLTSDGTLRFMALATLLLMPPERQPDIILLDEPELGLHPRAIEILGGLIKKASVDKQIIVSTQSPTMMNQFELDSIITVEMNDDGATQFKRLASNDYKKWLEEFSPAELWQNNVIG